MTPPGIVTASIHIDAEPERVFSFFVDPARIQTWLAQWVDIDPTPGGRLALDIRGTPIRGEFLEIDAGRRLLWSWGHAGSDVLPPGSSTVEVTFTAADGGTRVEVVHSRLPAPLTDSHRQGWDTLLQALSQTHA